MAEGLRLKRFTNAAILKRIEFSLLLEFFESKDTFRAFLADRGLEWTTGPDQFDYDGLAGILMSPDTDTPDELLDALYFVDGLADPDHYDRILEECQEAGVDLGPDDPSPEDLALRAWLADPNILERVHAEQYRVRPKKFESYFAANGHLPDLGYPSAGALAALDADLNDFFDFKKKGRGARVFPFPKNDGFWFLIRHGQRIKREGTVQAGGEAGHVFYRPEKFDVLIYYPDKGELAIYTETKGERKAYCRYLGKHLFGAPGFFVFDAPIAKYTLRPLIDQSRDTLVCSDVEGIERIRLYELHIGHDSEQKDIEVRKAHDAFRALEDHGRNLAAEESSISLLKAKFKVTFDGGKERAVTIEPPKTASFDREADNAVVHEWLHRRGFICTQSSEEMTDGEPDRAMAAG